MELTIKRIAGVYRAHIMLEGITVLAGKNNTGKSTVSKSLWSMVRSLDNVTKQVERERVVRYERTLDGLLHEITFDTRTIRQSYSEIRSLAQSLARRTEDGPLSPESIKGELQESFPHLQDRLQQSSLFDDESNGSIDRLSELADYSAIPSEDIARALLQRRLLNEFHDQVNNVDTRAIGTILLKHGTHEFSATIADDAVLDFHSGSGLQQTAIYLDDPFVLDYYQSTVVRRRYAGISSEDHRSHASTLTHPSESYTEDILGSIMVDKKLNEIMRKLNSVVSGSTTASRKHGIVYRRPEGGEDLDIRNISSGMKSFASIKVLLHEGQIHNGDVLILDEPENHLHPQWQLVFAELIVLLHKAFNLRVLMATHSPYFLRAVEVYSAHHEVADKCKYYHATRDEDGAHFQDVTLNTDQIYEDMSVPFNVLDDLMPEE